MKLTKEQYESLLSNKREKKLTLIKGSQLIEVDLWGRESLTLKALLRELLFEAHAQGYNQALREIGDTIQELNDQANYDNKMSE